MLLIVRSSLPSCVKISEVLIYYAYSNLVHTYPHRSLPSKMPLRFFHSVSCYGLLNTFYVVPVLSPGMECVHNNICSFRICFIEKCSKSINGNYVWGLSQSFKKSRGDGMNPGGIFFAPPTDPLVEKLPKDGSEGQFSSKL